MTFTIKQNDTSPAISYILSDQDGPVNLTGASVRFYCGSIVAEDADVTDAFGGQVTYEWVSADTAQPGYYRAEFEVVYADGSKETFPNEGYIGVYIEADLGEPPA